MSARTRTRGRIRALALATVVLALLTGTLLTGALPPNLSRAAADSLEPGADFSITSTVTSSPTSADHAALLYPGITRYLWYTVRNPLPQAITVTSLGIDHIEAPATCPVTNLNLADPGHTGSFVVPGGTSATVLAPQPIELINLPDVNQDACQGVTFTFRFTGTGWYADTAAPGDDPSPGTPAQVGTATMLTSGPSPAFAGATVTLSARVMRTAAALESSAATAPQGTIRFFRRGAGGGATLLGAAQLDAQGHASLSLTSLPGGTGELYAVYVGADTFAGSTSALTAQTVIAPPVACTATYTTSILGSPGSPAITGTTGNDFIYAVGGDYRISAGKGNDCIVVGDGTNVISDGSGADVVLAGHGRNRITVTGSGNTVIVGDGSGNRITVKGTKKGRKVRATNRNQLSLGDGSANRVTVRKGSKNVITLGAGSRNRVTIGKGKANRITIGNGGRNVLRAKGTRSVVTLGTGTKNRVTITRSGTRSTCSLPKPPTTWRSGPARYYRDTILRCRVVTR